MLAVLFPLLLVAGPVVGLIAWLRRRLGETVESWSAVSSHLGLHYEPGTLTKQHELTGELLGCRVRVWTYVQRSGENSSTYTAYEIRHTPLGPPVTLRRQTSFSFLRRIVGGRDVEIGDPLLDEQVIIDTDHPSQLAAFMNPARRAAVLSIFETWGNAEMTHQSIKVTRSGAERSAHRLDATIRRLLDTARILAAPEEVDAVLESQADGDLSGATAHLHELARQHDNTFVRLLTAENATSFDHGAATAELDELAAALPGDPLVEQWTSVASRPAPTNNSQRATDLDLSQTALISDVLGSGRRGSEIERHFENTYAGAQVRWTGTVDSVRPYLVDADFGANPGTKVSIEIGGIDTRFGTDRVAAVVSFPEGVEPRREAEVTFLGTLFELDRFTRNIYVRDASIVGTTTSG